MIKAIQHLVYWPFHLLALLLGVKVHMHEGMELLQPLILAGNHPTRLDPFIVTVSLPLKAFRELAPIYFPTSPGYYRSLFPILAPLGAYPLKRRALSIEEHIQTSVDILKRGNSIYISPEGSLTRNKKIKAKAGIVYIAKATRAKVLPIYLDKFTLLALALSAFRIKPLKVVIGTPRSLNTQGEDKYSHRQIAADLLDTIHSLKENIV